MAAVDEIAIKLGIKTGDLKSALTDANVQIKAFGEQGSHHADGLASSVHEVSSAMRGLHHLIAAGGIMAVVKEFFEIAIHRANELKDSTDANVHAVKEFGEGVESVKHGFADFAVLTVGTFNRLGAAIGDTINIAKSFIQNGSQGFEVWAKNADAVAATAHAAEEAERNLAEARKKHGAEFEAITKSLAELDKKSQEQRLKGLTIYDTELNQAFHLEELKSQLAASEGTAVEKRRLALEIAKAQFALDETQLAVKKDRAAEEKKTAEQAQKDLDARKKAVEEAIKTDRERRALSKSEELEIFLLQQKNAALLTKAERDLLDLRILQRKEKSNQIDIDDLLLKRTREGLTPEEAKRLAELSKQTDALHKQIEAKIALAGTTANTQLPAEKGVTDELEKQLKLEQQRQAAAQSGALAAFQSTSTQVTGDVRTLSNIQLEALLAKLMPRLEAEQQADAIYAGVGATLGLSKSFQQVMLQQNVDAVKREQDARRNFEHTVQVLGSEFAERTFSPDEFARLSQLINPDIVKKQAASIDRIDRTLTTLFPKQSQGIPVNPPN